MAADMLDGIMALVAPLAGAWIETFGRATKRTIILVAPLAGAWIETDDNPHPNAWGMRRSPRGSVD